MAAAATHQFQEVLQAQVQLAEPHPMEELDIHHLVLPLELLEEPLEDQQLEPKVQPPHHHTPDTVKDDH